MNTCIRQFVLGTPQITVERGAATTLGAVMLLPFESSLFRCPEGPR
ncbi:MAG: hypothetical protein ACP5RN_11790 [Armatimonadota bacterium]